MIIKSSFKDYYDSAQSYGQNFELRYIRSKKEIVISRSNYGGNSASCWPSDISWDVYVVGFCGKIYPFVHASREKEKWFLYELDKIDEFVERYFQDFQKEKYYEKDRWWAYSRNGSRGMFEHRFAELQKSVYYLSVFDEYKVPIFTEYTKFQYKEATEKYIQYLVLNPILRPLEFFKVFPPAEAFQEIQMYLANQASPEKEIPKIDDKTMAEVKGFDKYSFRKEPSSKKRKK